MPVLRAWLSSHARTQRGAAMVEYIFLVFLVALIVFIAVQFFGEETSSKFNDAGISVRDEL